MSVKLKPSTSRQRAGLKMAETDVLSGLGMAGSSEAEAEPDGADVSDAGGPYQERSRTDSSRSCM